jgi:hypothetical protein
MGACSIIVSAQGKNMRDAFNNAVQEANEEYGHQQGYSGAINNCELTGDWTNKRSNYPEDDHFHEAILQYANKRDVIGYCTQDPIGNTNKTKSEVKNMPQHGSRKWETRYIAVPRYGDSPNTGISEKTQTEAIKKARAYVEKNPGLMLEVRVTKILTEGQTVCAEVRYKKSSRERLGSYTFVGWAPE